MSYALIDTTDLSNLGDAIRSKTGISAIMSVGDMTNIVGNIDGQHNGWQWIEYAWNKSNGNAKSIAKNSTFTTYKNLYTGEIEETYPFIVYFGLYNNVSSGMPQCYEIIIYDGAGNGKVIQIGATNYTLNITYQFDFNNNRLYFYFKNTTTATSLSTYYMRLDSAAENDTTTRPYIKMWRLEPPANS